MRLTLLTHAKSSLWNPQRASLELSAESYAASDKNISAVAEVFH